MCMYIILIILNLFIFSWASSFNTYISTHIRTRNILIYYTLLPKHLHTTHHTHTHTYTPTTHTDTDTDTHTYIHTHTHIYKCNACIYLNVSNSPVQTFFCSKCHWFQVSIWKSRNLLWLNANTVFYLYWKLNYKTFYGCNLFRGEVS